MSQPRKQAGMINLLLFLIVGVFLSSQPVGRTLDYLAGSWALE